VADLALLNGALDLEHTAIFAYGLAGGSGLLGKAALAVGGTFRSSHETHREALSAVITGLGGSPVEARRGYDFSAFELKTETDVLRLALFLEMKAARAYQSALAKVQSRSLLEAAARIMGDEVSHAAILRAVLGKAPVGFFGQIDEVGFEG
jgi:bacterioferritin (cytochrome b1)